MNRILLLGAGFSRNWGGWLASEAHEYLIGCEQLDAGLRQKLWDYQHKGGGFEALLDELQSDPDERLKKFQDAVLSMFSDMNQAFESAHFDASIISFLTRFNVIFTLNQDMLFERCYPQGSVSSLSIEPKWDGWSMPEINKVSDAGDGLWEPRPHPFDEPRSRTQCYFKLHGSSNWKDKDSNNLMVLGGNKESTIARFPVLEWYHARFQYCLSKPDTRLMVVGYSFADDHINKAIIDSASGNNIRIFIVDPDGTGVIDKRRDAREMGAIAPNAPTELTALQPFIFGASRRPLTSTLDGDDAERQKLMRFLGLI